MTRDQIADAIRVLLAAGLTVRDVAELLRAHPRAIEALMTNGQC